MSIGKKLRELLKSQEIEEIAFAKHLGISPDRLSNYLDDKREPDLSMLDRMAEYLSVNLSYFVDIVDMQEQPCRGIKLGDIEDMHDILDNHQNLVDYVMYRISDLGTETIEERHIYAYVLGLSNACVVKVCKSLDDYIMRERKRILGRELV